MNTLKKNSNNCSRFAENCGSYNSFDHPEVIVVEVGGMVKVRHSDFQAD